MAADATPATPKKRRPGPARLPPADVAEALVAAARGVPAGRPGTDDPAAAFDPPPPAAPESPTA